jgi:MFS family permease
VTLPSIRLGIRENLPQFSLLVLINGFVGAMVGVERAIIPLIAEHNFGIASKALILSFLIGFGIVKAFSNLLAGVLAEKLGRKRILVVGWLFGLPVPFLLIYAPSWDWITFANLLLGVNQGLCWSATVIMKVDLAGPQRHGLAMGLNEFAGYFAVAIAAYASGSIAATFGLRPYPFALGIGFTCIGLALSLLLTKETSAYALLESTGSLARVGLKEVFARTSWRDRSLFACSQAGMVNNLNDGAAWGLFPLLFAISGLSIERISLLAAIYPATWGVGQLFAGALSDRYGRKWMIVLGMWLQGAAIVALAFSSASTSFAMAMLFLGIGTAMVYPTLLASVSDFADPAWRASAIGVYRWWRDLGYAIGAILSGIIADLLTMNIAIAVVGVLTAVSGVIVAFEMSGNSRRPQQST